MLGHGELWVSSRRGRKVTASEVEPGSELPYLSVPEVETKWKPTRLKLKGGLGCRDVSHVGILRKRFNKPV
jgi:hypothetical protein